MPLDIKIKVDPGNSVQQAAGVEHALAKIEDTGEKANQAVAKGMRQIGNDANKAMQQIDKSIKLTSDRIRDVGKGIAFGLINDGLKQLTSSLDGVSGAAVNAAAGGASVGAAFGGPLGAAIGATAGAVQGLITGFLEEERAAERLRLEIEEQARAYWAGVEAAQRRANVENLLADTYRKTAQAAREAAEAEHIQASARDDQSDRIRRLQATISGYEDQLQRVKGLGGISFPTPLGPGSEEEQVITQRNLRDAQLELEIATKSYGATLGQILKAENERKDRIADLEQILGRESLTQEASKRILDEINTLYRAGGRTVDEYNKALAERNRLERENAEIEKELAELRDRRPLEVELDQINRALTGDKFGDGIKQGADKLREILESLQKDFQKVGEEQAKELAESQKKAAEKALEAQIKLAEKAEEAAERVREAWATGLGSIAAELTNMATEGEFQLEKLAGSMAKLLLQIAAMQIGGPWGTALDAFAGGLSFGMGGSGTVPYDLPRAANGLSGVIGGAGGTDSRLFMARVTPGEHFEFRTPAQQQRHEAARMPVIKNQTVIQVQSDPREVTSAMSTRAGQREIAKLRRKFRDR